MPHRSDEEALRAKLEERERELANAKRDLSAVERRLEEQQREAERVRRSGGSTVNRPTLGRRPMLTVVVGLFVVLGVGLFVAIAVLRSPAPMPPPYPPAVVHSTAPIAPSPPPAVPPAAPLNVTLGARATAVSGDTPVRENDACLLRATISPGPRLGLLDLVVECAGTRLYGSRDPVAGVSMTESDVFAWPGEGPGTLRYELVFSDTGPRSTGAEAVFHSWSGEGAVYRTGLGAFRVDLELDAVTDAVPEPPGSAIHHVPGLPPHTRRTGVVRSIEPAGIAVGTHCRLALRPNPGGTPNTRAHVRCGMSTVYGAGTSGFLPRDGDSLSDTEMTPVDNDPAITIDLAAGTVSIRDTRAGVIEAIEIALDAAPPAAPPPAPGAPALSPALPPAVAPPAAPAAGS